jgi:hypothetical protein
MSTANPLNMLIAPRRTSRAVASQDTIYPSLAIVLGFSIALSILFYISYLAKAYPPPADELKVWIEAWGAWAMTPVVIIPMESYRLFLAIIMLPLVLATWILMAGSARFLSILMKGRGSYDQYLNLLAFSFFPFWILALLMDFIYSAVLGSYVTPALQMEYGAMVQTFFLYFPQLMYPLILGAGGVYNFIVTRQLEGFAVWKAAIIGMITAAWPILATAILFR